jgi:hypothetical protein
VRLLTRGDVQEKLNCVLSIKILSMAILKEFLILVAKFTVCDKLYVFSKGFTCFDGYFHLNSLCLCLQITNSDFGLYRYFKVASSILRYTLTSEGALYRLNIIKLAVLVTN